MTARDDYPNDSTEACDEIDRLRAEVERLRGPRSLPGWMIMRRNGQSAGPFRTRREAEDYINPGDSVVPVKATPGAFRS
jgi:hypothetical protein